MIYKFSQDEDELTYLPENAATIAPAGKLGEMVDIHRAEEIKGALELTIRELREKIAPIKLEIENLEKKKEELKTIQTKVVNETIVAREAGNTKDLTRLMTERKHIMIELKKIQEEIHKLYAEKHPSEITIEEHEKMLRVIDNLNSIDFENNPKFKNLVEWFREHHKKDEEKELPNYLHPVLKKKIEPIKSDLIYSTEPARLLAKLVQTCGVLSRQDIRDIFNFLYRRPDFEFLDEVITLNDAFLAFKAGNRAPMAEASMSGVYEQSAINELMENFSEDESWAKDSLAYAKTQFKLAKAMLNRV